MDKWISHSIRTTKIKIKSKVQCLLLKRACETRNSIASWKNVIVITVEILFQNKTIWSMSPFKIYFYRFVSVAACSMGKKYLQAIYMIIGGFYKNTRFVDSLRKNQRSFYEKNCNDKSVNIDKISVDPKLGI